MSQTVDSRYGKLVNVVAHDGKLHRSRHGVVVVVIVPVPAEVVAVIACCVVVVRVRLVKGELCLFGGYWWLAKTCLFLVTQPLTNQLLTKFCSVRQIPEGTKTGQNHRKIKSRTPCSEYPHLNICYSGAKVQICPVKNESKRIKFTSIVHFLFSCTTMDNTNRFLPRLDVANT